MSLDDFKQHSSFPNINPPQESTRKLVPVGARWVQYQEDEKGFCNLANVLRAITSVMGYMAFGLRIGWGMIEKHV